MKTGLEIVTGLIAALKEVATVAETAKSGDDPRFVAARVKLGEALEPAYVDERDEWMYEVGKVIQATHDSWVKHQTKAIVDFRSTGAYRYLKVSDARADCLDLILHLERFEPRARECAEAAKQEILKRLLG